MRNGERGKYKRGNIRGEIWREREERDKRNIERAGREERKCSEISDTKEEMRENLESGKRQQEI